jgi:DNA-binding response OmpR family regulator
MQTVLLVEDEAAIREVAAAYLARAGFKVIQAADGNEGLRSWKTEKPDVVLLDLNLPGKDGLEVCREIRRENSEVPIFMVTARVEESDELKGLSLGADDYLKKPFSAKVLVARVQALLRRNGTSTVHVFPNLTISAERQSIEVAGEWQQLTTLPFQILSLLSEHPEKIFSRDEILDRVYGDAGTEVFDRVIDAHIKGIRKKLGPCAHYLQTVVGSGYKFSPVAS